jgi:DNA replication protein DnaC
MANQAQQKPEPARSETKATLPKMQSAQDVLAASFPPTSRTQRLLSGEGSECPKCKALLLPEDAPKHAADHEEAHRKAEELRQAERERRAARLDRPLSEMLPNIGITYDAARITDFPERLARAGASFIESKSPGMLIQGPVGTGKTRFAAAMCREYLLASKSVDFYLTRSLLRRIWNTYRDRAEESEERALADLASQDLLVLDDLGHEGKVSDAVVGALHELLTRRHDNLRPTIITTNLTLRQISELYDASIASRLSAWVSLLIEGQDRRKPR